MTNVKYGKIIVIVRLEKKINTILNKCVNITKPIMHDDLDCNRIRFLNYDLCRLHKLLLFSECGHIDFVFDFFQPANHSSLIEFGCRLCIESHKMRPWAPTKSP